MVKKRFFKKKLSVEKTKKGAATLKKKAETGALASLAAVGITVNSTFATPADLLPEVSVPVEITMEMPGESPDGEMTDSDEGTSSEEEEEKGGIRNLLRQRILKLPWGLRAALGVPLWGIGFLLVKGIFWLGNLLSPLLHVLLRWGIIALVLAGVFLIVMKWLFPDMPVSKILSKRNLIGILIGVLAIGVLGKGCSLFFPQFGKAADLFGFAGGLVLLLIFGFSVYRENKGAYVYEE